MIYQIQPRDVGKRSLLIGKERVSLPGEIKQRHVNKRLRYRPYKSTPALRITIESDEEYVKRMADTPILTR